MPRPPHLTFLITDLDRGGSPLLLAALAPGLLAHGFEVEVVSIAPEGEVAGLLRERGVPVFSMNAEGAGDFSVVPRFANHVRQCRPDIVASILIHANLLAVLAKPFVQSGITWVQSIHTLQERPRWHWYAQGVLSSFADSFVAPSRAAIHKVAAFGPVPRAMVIPNGIEVARFREASPLPESDRPWPKDAFVVGYLGRFDPVKRIPLLLHAAALLKKKLPALHVALVGYGSQESKLRTLATSFAMPGSIHFIPPTPTPERWYKTFDVFCSPSAAEGFGLTLAEAAAAGVPVIAVDTPAVRETLQKALWIPEDATPQAIAQKLLRVFEAKPVLTTFCTPPVKLHTLDAMISHYAQYFRALLRGL